MDKTEALAVLETHLLEWRERTYSDLAAFLKTPVTTEIQGPTGVTYQVQVQVVWDGRKGGDLRVLGAVDDGGWRAFHPLCSDFIMAPDGSFIDE
jgi:hypothetical protein